MEIQQKIHDIVERSPYVLGWQRMRAVEAGATGDGGGGRATPLVADGSARHFQQPRQPCEEFVTVHWLGIFNGLFIHGNVKLIELNNAVFSFAHEVKRK